MPPTISKQLRHYRKMHGLPLDTPVKPRDMHANAKPCLFKLPQTTRERIDLIAANLDSARPNKTAAVITAVHAYRPRSLSFRPLTVRTHRNLP